MQTPQPSQFFPASADDIDVGARTIYGEARGEFFNGMVAVAWSLRNRAAIDLWNDKKPDWWGEGIAGVCKKQGQYDCWWDHNAAIIKHVTLSDPAFQHCMLAMLGTVTGLIPDPTFGSTHYYNPDAVKRTPAWAIGRMPAVVIGRHHFFTGLEPGAPGYKKV